MENWAFLSSLSTIIKSSTYEDKGAIIVYTDSNDRFVKVY
jgi:hypothetical protein